MAADLATLLSTVERHGDFFATGTAELLPPAINIPGVGRIALPLLPAQAEQIRAVAGSATLRDPTVRRCWQIGPDRVTIGGRHWARTLAGIVARATEGLAVAAPVSAAFYSC